ncbi:MAG: hypothetical protein M1834_008447 [Cirrosporium novae-zelandiae]|nr:MAG: hypothetical protein M1834_008447 [Cirrosporium novae-zelandiae]
MHVPMTLVDKMSSKSVLVEKISSSAVTITLNRPHALNAINTSLLNDLVEALRNNSNARVIVLEGAGDRAFCTGEDLKETLAPATGSTEELRDSLQKLQDLTRLTASSSAIVISAVQGYAIGGGAEIALAADFVIGGPATKFRFPEVPLGHAATGGITQRLVSMVGLLRAKELLLSGRMVDAEESLKIGLLTEIAEYPKRRAKELALQMAAMPATSVLSSKMSLERATFPNSEAVLQDEVVTASHCFAQTDAEKAFSNFAQRKTTKTITPPVPTNDLNSALARAVGEYPSRTFLRFTGKDYTYREFDTAVAQLAGGLKKAGITTGDRVLVMMKNSVEMVHSWFATNRLAATWVPINSELKSATLKHVVDAADAKIAIVDKHFYGEFIATGFPPERVFLTGKPEVSTIDHLYMECLYSVVEPVNDPARVLPSTVSAFLYTSGTTGRSKPCILSHQYFILQASILINSYSIVSSDVLYCPFPLFHADATALTTVPALLLGATAALSVRFSRSRFWDEIRSSGATVYDFMGATLALTYKNEPSPRDRDHNVRLAWGVPVPSWAKQYEERFGHPIYELYGSVEASLPITQRGPRIPGSCGTVVDGYSIRIADDHGEAVPTGTIGNLLVRTEQPYSIFSGYFNNPQATADAFRHTWFHTGDLARVDAAGNFFFLGRTKDMIRRRGENISAFEVEEELLRNPDIICSAAFAIPAKLGGEGIREQEDGIEDDIKVAVVARPEARSRGFDEQALWNWTVENMARFQVPCVIEFVDRLKKTPTGKIEKGGLRAEGGTRFDIRKHPTA